MMQGGLRLGCKVCSGIGRHAARGFLAAGRVPAPIARVVAVPALRRLSRPLSSTDDSSDNDFAPQKKAVPEGQDEVHKMIKQQITDNKLMLYMKGTPSQPQCGFSMQVVRILQAQGVDFSSVNVLEYASIREGVKSFSEWPTIPQVFLDGEFVGGCDILTQLHEDGELQKMLEAASLK